MPETPAAPFNLNPCRLNFVAPFQGTEETRYYLNGVHVEAHPGGGVVMVATDGHRLAIALDPDGACPAPVIISTKSAGPVFKPKPGRHDTMRVEFSCDIGLGKNQLFAKRRNVQGDIEAVGIIDLIDGTFPDWRRAVPWNIFDAKDRFSGTFNFDLLKTFGAKFGEASTSVAVRQKSETDPAIIYRPGLPWFLGVLMPVVTHAQGSPISDEIRALAPSPKAA